MSVEKFIRDTNISHTIFISHSLVVSTRTCWDPSRTSERLHERQVPLQKTSRGFLLWGDPERHRQILRETIRTRVEDRSVSCTLFILKILGVSYETWKSLKQKFYSLFTLNYLLPFFSLLLLPSLFFSLSLSLTLIVTDI